MPHRSQPKSSGNRTHTSDGQSAGGTGRERRTARRVRLSAPMAVRWDGHAELSRIRILDISRTGFRFECSRVYSMRERGHAVSIKPEDTRIESDFVIVWSREMAPGRYQYGARFVKSQALRKSA